MYAVISNPDWHPCHEKYERERQIAVYILTIVLISLVFFFQPSRVCSEMRKYSKVYNIGHSAPEVWIAYDVMNIATICQVVCNDHTP